MKKNIWKKIPLILSPIAISSIAMSCSEEQKEPNKKNEISVKDYKNKLLSKISQLKDKKGFENAINTGATSEQLQKLEVEINKAINDEFQSASFDEVKIKTISLLDQLKNKKDYQSQIHKATTKEMLSIIQNKINSDLEKQNDVNGESLREAISIFNEITSSPTYSKHFTIVETGGFSRRTMLDVLSSTIVQNSGNWTIIINPELQWAIQGTPIRFTASFTRAKNDNKTGNLTAYINFKNKLNNVSQTVKVNLSGLKSNPIGVDENGTFLEEPNEDLKSDLELYYESNQDERFKLDDEKYLNVLKRQLAGREIDTLNKRRPELVSNNQDNIKKYNDLADKLGLSNYESAAWKGFSLPKYNYDGTVEGLSIYNQPEPIKGPSWVDSIGKNHNKILGLARTITNENYVRQAKQTFHIGFSGTKIPVPLHNGKIADRDQRTTIFYKDIVKKLEDSNTKTELTNFANSVTEPYNISTAVKLKTKVNEELLKIKSEQEIEEIKKSVLKDYVNNSNLIPSSKNSLLEDINIGRTNADGMLDQSSGESGTIWLMDYQKRSDGKYPTKFYFGTNLHVADAMIEGSFNSYSLVRLNKEIGILNTLKLINLDTDKFRSFYFKPESIKRVFDGRDYLTTSPKDFLTNDQKQAYENVEEFLDFAVLEIDFEKDTNNTFERDKSEFARIITNDYASEENKENQIKFKTESYLKNYDKINFPLRTRNSENFDFNSIDQLFILGYPLAVRDHFLEPYVDDDQLKFIQYDYSLWTNADYTFYKINLGEDDDRNAKIIERLNRGNWLSYNIGYRTFKNKPGINDAFLSAPRIGSNLYKSSADNKDYVVFGLQYMPRWYVPYGGASGSSVRTQNNELVAVFHSANESAKTGLAAAFRFEGYDYNGLFGTYNLPQYDLIYGGGKTQNIQTNLFPNGLDDSQIPNEFRFEDELINPLKDK
ncbi:Ig-specific serine endopeptidase MIP [Mycoplasmopsis felis]|uniref:Ig-specific serine endopeptidase MIP n=1 Tax=Mycoplasmopsis felis TaxID=33923 RepID=UPI000691E65D|nr:DUF31 family protein [Mycoplasmopsis felis]